MQIIDNWKTVVLERYTKFDGRARRSEYWLYLLAQIIVVFGLLILTSVSSIFFILYLAWLAGTFLPSVAVSIRRLHDTGKSGWFLLLGLVPVVGGVIVLVLMLLDSNRGPNAYGPSDKYDTATA